MSITVIAKPVVLVVEDEELLRLIVEDMLTDAGFELVAVGDGSQAISTLEEDADRFSVIVTDIRIGEGPSGWDVARRAREIVPTMPVVYMTGDSAAAWAANGVPNSILLQKPFAEAQLVTALGTLLNQAAATRLD